MDRLRLVWHALRPVWGGEGAGAAWLALATGVAFLLGLALQLIGLRSLDGGDYATFVFALGLGNIAAAVAAAVQPVVAFRAGTARPAFLPARPALLVGLALGTGAVAALLLAPEVGAAVAVLALLQIPLHTAVGVGVGRLQHARAFARIAVAQVLQMVARIAIVLPWVVAGRASALPFVAALALALLAALALLLAAGAFRGTAWESAADARALLATYALWALVAWLLNADALYARLTLSVADGDAYALALTLGRQPLYAVAPLAVVLLPVTLAADPAEQRARLRAILAVSALLLLGTLLVLAVWTRPLIDLLTGDETGDPLLVRGYAVVGSLAAAATLLLTFAFALDRPPRLRLLVALALVPAPVALLLDDPRALLALQATVVAALLALCWRSAFRATIPA